MKMTHELAHCLFEGGLLLAQMDWGIFSNGQDLVPDKGLGWGGGEGGGPFEKGLPSVTLFAFVITPHALNALLVTFSVLCRRNATVQWSMQWPKGLGEIGPEDPNFKIKTWALGFP